MAIEITLGMEVTGIVTESLGAAAGATPTFVEYEDHYAGGSSAIIPAPGSVEDGDLMIAIIGSDVSGDTISSAPAGWTKKISESNDGCCGTIVCYTKTASSESGTYTFTWTSSDPSGGFMFVLRGGAWDTSGTVNGTVASTSHVLPDITTSSDNCLLLQCLIANWNSGYSVTAEGDGTVSENTAHGGTAGFTHGSAYEEQADAGATGTRTWTYGSSRNYNGYLISIKPE
jgi:hypothetical protein